MYCSCYNNTRGVTPAVLHLAGRVTVADHAAAVPTRFHHLAGAKPSWPIPMPLGLPGTLAMVCGCYIRRLPDALASDWLTATALPWPPWARCPRVARAPCALPTGPARLASAGLGQLGETAVGVGPVSAQCLLIFFSRFLFVYVFQKRV
jgi:hypothetical protein